VLRFVRKHAVHSLPAMPSEQEQVIHVS
jgi:hypothetical protein